MRIILVIFKYNQLKRNKASELNIINNKAVEDQAQLNIIKP